MILNALPGYPFMYCINVLETGMEFCSYFFASFLALKGANCSYVFFRQYCIPMLFSNIPPSACKGIVDVLLRASRCEMIRIYAKWRIARMKHIFSVPYSSFNKMRNLMCAQRSGLFIVVGRKFAIAIGRDSSSPFPAITPRSEAGSFINVGKECLNLLCGKYGSVYSRTRHCLVSLVGKIMSRIAVGVSCTLGYSCIVP